MRILPVSDLHVDLWLDHGQELLQEWGDINPDLVLIAGDVGELRSIIVQDFLRNLSKDQEIVYVLGNHEYWGSSPQQVNQILDGLINPNIHILDNSDITIKGQRFVGGTLWYPPPGGHMGFPDYRRIQHFEPWVYQQNRQLVALLDQNINENDMVITHHVPTDEAVRPMYVGDKWNRFFISPQDEIIKRTKPKLWLFGHTHFSWDFNIGKTRMLCNPRAYKSENPNFKPTLTVEI